jgi:maleamate amidohydrolase
MTDIAHFEDHCWQGFMPQEILELYAAYKRETYIGPRPALLAIDLFELAYEGGPLPVTEVAKTYPSSCGENAWNALPPTKALFDVARRTGVPVFYSEGDRAPNAKPKAVSATLRQNRAPSERYAIRADIAPQADDVVIRKQRASAFFGTPLAAHLTQLGVDTVIVFGQSTSGCVRASVVDGYSHGFHMVMAEECCFDRSNISHMVNLFDLHHKYADLIRTDEIIGALEAPAKPGAVKSDNV